VPGSGFSSAGLLYGDTFSLINADLDRSKTISLAVSGSYPPTGGLLSGLNSYFDPKLIFDLISSANGIRCLSYYPASGTNSFSLAIFSFKRVIFSSLPYIKTSITLGKTCLSAASISNYPGPGPFTGLNSYLDPKLILDLFSAPKGLR